MVYLLTLHSLLLAETLRAQSQRATATRSIPSVGEAVMVDIDPAQPDKMFQGYLFWHQADELATDVVNFALQRACSEFQGVQILG